jgi:hypothetical protein
VVQLKKYDWFSANAEQDLSGYLGRVISSKNTSHPDFPGLAFPCRHSLGRTMISKQWRERLIYAAMSAFVAWHTLAMLIAPAPEESELAKLARGVFQPYLVFFNLDNHWDFFAPNISGNSVFRYVIKDSSGIGHTFMPMSKWGWFSPNSIWFHDWYEAVMEESNVYADTFAKFLCREHAELKPVSIVLQAVTEREFGPADFLNGKQPLDPQFVKVEPVKNVKCPGP